MGPTATPLDRISADETGENAPRAFSLARLDSHFAALIGDAEEHGGVEAYLSALSHKCSIVRRFLDGAGSGAAVREGLLQALAVMFTARRRLYPALVSVDLDRLAVALNGLRQPEHPAMAIQRLVDLLPGVDATDRASLRVAARLRRAAWDFAAEMMHFDCPEKTPLMTRWVWDASTQTGACRELLTGSDTLVETGLGSGVDTFRDARAWLIERLRDKGIFRDLPLWADLVLAQAYVGYVRIVTEGSLGGDFARGSVAGEQLRKLLGIDPPRTNGETRVRLTSDSCHAHS